MEHCSNRERGDGTGQYFTQFSFHASQYATHLKNLQLFLEIIFLQSIDFIRVLAELDRNVQLVIINYISILTGNAGGESNTTMISNTAASALARHEPSQSAQSVN